MNTNIASKFVQLQDAKIHYLEAGENNDRSVLFLHGASFSAQTWQEIGTLKLLAEQGYHVVAVDLPGYGKSERRSGSNIDFLLQIMAVLNLNKPVLVSPSMSGNYSLPFVAKKSDRLSGFVPIAPVGITIFTQQVQAIELPTLIIWGSNDNIVPIEQADELLKVLPNAEKFILEKAGHACYMLSTKEFHEHLIKFVKRCAPPIWNF